MDERPLKLGVVGTGSVVREIYQHLYFSSDYSAEIEICAVCDTDQNALQDFAGGWQIGSERTFSDYSRMLDSVELDAVAVNTPDNAHLEPTLAAIDRGLDVLLPKPTAGTIRDVDRMVSSARQARRYLGVDFHKRSDPVVREARARSARGDYGTLQTATMQMLDRLLVADPNHKPRFFSSPDFASQNSPVTFLTSHMADTFMTMTQLKPLRVQATGYKQKLPSLQPIAVDGYDLVDCTVEFETGVRCHITTGWALPNTAQALTVQWARLLFSDGLLDLWKEWYGYREITPRGLEDRNMLFLNFQESGRVAGYGIENPGEILREMRAFRDGRLGEQDTLAVYSPFVTGFYTTLVCECAQLSLDRGERAGAGVLRGGPVDCRRHVATVLGPGRLSDYYQQS